MLDVEVIETRRGGGALDPIRSRVLAVLAEPGSATTVARALGLPRQKVNYHLRALEAHGLVRLVEVRARRGLTERMLQATAAAYVVSPAALGGRPPIPAGTDRLSTRYLIALAARMVREVGDAVPRAPRRPGSRLPTLSIDTEIRFALGRRAGRLHRRPGRRRDRPRRALPRRVRAGGRWHRLVVAAHPRPTPEVAATDNPTRRPA